MTGFSFLDFGVPRVGYQSYDNGEGMGQRRGGIAACHLILYSCRGAYDLITLRVLRSDGWLRWGFGAILKEVWESGFVPSRPSQNPKGRIQGQGKVGWGFVWVEGKIRAGAHGEQAA